MQNIKFVRETYVITKLISSFSQDGGITHPMSKNTQKFFILRTLELYYRALAVVGGRTAPQDDRDKLVGVCFWIMHKFYDVSPMITLDILHPYIQNICPVYNVEQFCRDFRKMEIEVHNHVNWTLTPPGFIREENELTFHEPWQFKDGTQVTTPQSNEVLGSVIVHERCIEIIMAVKLISGWFNCKAFFMRPITFVNDKLKPLHAGVTALCQADGLFCNVMWSFCTERYGGKAPDYIKTCHLNAPRGEINVLQSIRKGMVKDMAALIEHRLSAKLTEVRTVEAKVLAHNKVAGQAFPSDLYELAENCCATLADDQKFYNTLVGALQKISGPSMQKCVTLGRSIDEAQENIMSFIKACDSAHDSLDGSATVTTMVRESDVLICTRVSPDPLATPKAGVLHSVDVIPGAVKVLIKTHKVRPCSKKGRVVKVEIKPGFAKACDLMAASYTLRGQAASAAMGAAQASEQVSSADAASLRAAAEAAIAAEAAEAAAEAAEAAEAAFTAAEAAEAAVAADAATEAAEAEA